MVALGEGLFLMSEVPLHRLQAAALREVCRLARKLWPVTLVLMLMHGEHHKLRHESQG